MSQIMSKTKRPQVAPGKRVPVSRLRSVKPEKLISYRVALLSHLIGRIVEHSVSQPLGVTSRQWRLLMLLNRFGPSTSGQIAADSPMDHSQVSRVSYELLDKGLISMRADPADRRKQTLAVTPAGTDVLRRGIVESIQRQQRLRDCMASGSYAVFDRALDDLISEARQMLVEREATD